MSFFNKVIASIGIGTVKVDTKISSSRVIQGGDIQGIIQISGGQTDQEIRGIKLHLMTRYVYDETDHPINCIIYTYKVDEQFIIEKEEVKELPFSFQIPFHTPMTIKDPYTLKNVPRVWIDTDLDIRHALHSRDYDPISIDPSSVYETIIELIEGIGFKRRNMKNISAPNHFKTDHPYVQRFKFLPSCEKYLGRLNNLDVYMLQEKSETVVYFEVEKKAKGVIDSIKEELDVEEHHEKITLLNADVLKNRDVISEQFTDIISRLV
ncbi:sporulation protein [Metabacillus fastidiosus]|uniref:sporulation protein n=1 Tax=Metabacillus fastidiosus TaxID=1458 RepID=UPI002E1EDCDC|nr:sporulation protein [Metabacillus fastidiosus]